MKTLIILNIVVLLVVSALVIANAQIFKDFGDNVVASNKVYEQAPAFDGGVSFAFKTGAFNLSNNLK